MSNLKPCPFCGSVKVDPPYNPKHDIECSTWVSPQCDCMGIDYDCSGYTPELWNSRAIESALLEALEGMVGVWERGHSQSLGPSDDIIISARAAIALAKGENDEEAK